MSDSMSIEPEAQGGAASFAPPISPPVSGSPGVNLYLQTDGAGTVSWAPKPTPGTTIPAGTGWVKQTAPGTFASIASVPAPQVSYSPSVPASWPIVVTEVDSALNSLSAQITSIAGFGYSPAVPSDWVTSPASLPTGLDLLAERVARPFDHGVLVTDEDFLTFSTSGTVLLGSTVTWQTSVSGTGAVVTSATAVETKTNTPGCVALSTGTTTTGRAGILLGPSSGAGGVKVSDGTNLAVFDYETTWFFPSLFSATDTGWFLAGLAGTITAATVGNYGLFWRYDGGATHTLSAVVRMAGAETGSAPNVATISAGTIYRTRVVSDGTTVKWMYATGRSGGTWTTSLSLPAATIHADAGWPTNLLGAAARVTKTAGTTAVRAVVDRFKLSHNTF